MGHEKWQNPMKWNSAQWRPTIARIKSERNRVNERSAQHGKQAIALCAVELMFVHRISHCITIGQWCNVIDFGCKLREQNNIEICHGNGSLKSACSAPSMACAHMPKLIWMGIAEKSLGDNNIDQNSVAIRVLCDGDGVNGPNCT